MDSSLDFLSSVLEEIALEGLDGITLPTLWVRLENRPLFPLALDDGSKSFIWECVAVHKDIEMFELPDPRPVLDLYDRYQHIDPEFGLVTEPDSAPDDIYPMKVVEEDSIRGSSGTYSSRTSITSHVRHGTVLLMSLNHVMEKWPDRIVLVASPKARLLALLGTEVNPLIEFTKEQYCLLERIGRSRYHGEVSQGESGLLIKCLALKAHLHYYASKLISKGLITKQKHILRSKSGKTIQGSLFHLTRFYVQRKVKFDSLLECMYNSLKSKPNNREEFHKLHDELGLPLSTFRKLLKRFAHKWFRVVTVPLKEMNPDASAEECFLKNGQPRQVKVIQMVQPYMEQEEENFNDNDDENNANPYFDPTKVYLDVPLILQAYNVVVNAGPNGVTLSEMRKALTLPKLEVRSLCRQLVRKNEVVTVMQDRGRQRFEKYISKKFEHESKPCISIKEQSEKFNCEQMDESGALNKAAELPSNEKDDASLAIDKSTIDESAKSSDFQNIQSEVIEVTDGTKYTLKNSARVLGFSGSLGDRYNSPRLLKRANILIDHIKSVKLTTVTDLGKVIAEKEAAEGYNFKVDKKSVIRLVNRLCTDRLAKAYKTTLKLNDNVKELEFICHPSLDCTDSEFKTAIEKAKFKYFCTDKSTNKSDANKLSAEASESPVKESNKSVNKENKSIKHYAPAYGKQIYGLQPKFVRTKALHLFLSYLMHFYEGEQIEEQEGLYVYHQSDMWKRFIPPLQQSNREGWCVLSDAISRMPLSIFVKINNLRYEIPGLESVLADPIQQHYLIKYLPQELRNNLLSKRQYVFMIYEIVRRLCHMGLVSLGPKLRFEKDQVCIYINKKASIKDTTVSPPGYLQIDKNVIYETKEYYFHMLNDVEKYWIDLETICLHTPLGRYSVATEEKFFILDPNQKPELTNAVKNNDFDDVVDTGECPGDGLGAGGLDSSLYSHCRRNWVWPNIAYRLPIPRQKTNSKPKRNSSLQYLLEKDSKKTDLPESRVRLQRLTRQVLVPSRKRPCPFPSTKIAGGKKVKTGKMRKVRTVMRKPLRTRQPFYDEKDKAAMKCMNTMKVSWSSQEDSLLLMCKVASVFLDPNFKRLVVPFAVIRDVLHTHLPNLACNKTSRSCQRRMRHMLVHSEETRYSVDVFLGEVRQDSELVKEYDRVKPVKTKELEWREMFTGLLSKLVKKFTSASYQNSVVLLPDTVEVLKSNYSVSYPIKPENFGMDRQEPQDEISIDFATVTAFILLSLSSVEEANNLSFILYKVYEQYPEAMLRNAIGELCKRQLITKKISYKRSNLRKQIQPSSVPYRFSITYENSLHVKYPTKVYSEAVEFIDTVKKGNLQLDGDIPAGHATSLISLVSCNMMQIEAEIPEQIIVFDASFDERCRSTFVKDIMPSLNEEESQELATMLVKKNTVPRSDENSDEPKAKRRKLDNQSNDPSTAITSEELKDAEFEGTTDVSISHSSRLALYMLGDSLSKPKSDSLTHSTDFVSINPCRLTCSLTSDDTGILSLDAASPTKKPTLEIMDEIISTHSSCVNTELMTAEDHAALYAAALEKHHLSTAAFQDGWDIFNTICSSEKLGILHLDLWKKYRNLNGELPLLQHLSLLLESRLVLRVGTVSFRYVGIMHCKPWLVSSFVLLKDSNDKAKADTSDTGKTMPPNPAGQITIGSNGVPSEGGGGKAVRRAIDLSNVGTDRLRHTLEPIMFIPRSWKKPDGTLNCDMFLQLLRSVLCCIMSAPGITEQKVCASFSLPLQPVQTLELLEVLEKMSCIFKYYSKSPKKGTLFSACSEIVVSECPQPDDITHYEPCPDAIIKMSKISSYILSTKK